MIYIDTSAHLPRHYPPQLLDFVSTHGRNKVLFGTNGPQLSFVECAEQARSLNPRRVRRWSNSCGLARRRARQRSVQTRAWA